MSPFIDFTFSVDSNRDVWTMRTNVIQWTTPKWATAAQNVSSQSSIPAATYFRIQASCHGVGNTENANCVCVVSRMKIIANDPKCAYNVSGVPRNTSSCRLLERTGFTSLFGSAAKGQGVMVLSLVYIGASKTTAFFHTSVSAARQHIPRRRTHLPVHMRH